MVFTSTTVLDSKAESIQIFYKYYLQEKFAVNRRYQRKLVWQMNEKEAFIDSIANKYSVPLILLAKNSNIDGAEQFEIIDGMQRLNSIFSFIENEFGLHYNGKLMYFDLNTLAETKILSDNGSINQREPILPQDICLEIVSYQLPITYVTASEGTIEEIFRRINSYGRQLSNQEIRQAGALGLFPDLVRTISSNIRGDVSTGDSLSLSKMKFISLSNRMLPYGINVNKTFWVKQGIIPAENMRTSRDEEEIAWILLYALGHKDKNPSSHILNVLYKHEQDNLLLDPIEDSIKKIGRDNVIKWMSQTFDSLQKVLDASKKTFVSLIFNDKKRASGLVRVFQVVFLAFYELLIKERMAIANIVEVYSSLDGIGDRTLAGIKDKEWTAKSRNEMVDSITGILRKNFTPKNGSDVASENWTMQLENLLRLSRIEGNGYDFKLGLFDLKPGAQFNEALLRKCIKTLTAEVNKGPNTRGYVVFGVADNESVARAHEQFYHSTSKITDQSNFFVTGINDEVDRYYNSKIDDYIKKMKAIIVTEPIETEYKSQIMSNIMCVDYYEKDVVILSMTSSNKPVSYSEQIFVRESNDIKELKTYPEILAIQARFGMK